MGSHGVFQRRAREPDLWAEVVVDGASLGRAKLGAVPFAVEAAHAMADQGRRYRIRREATADAPSRVGGRFSIEGDPNGT
jgi:hypothetical protein